MSAQIQDISDQRTLDVFNNQSFGDAGIAPVADTGVGNEDFQMLTTRAIEYRINGQGRLLAIQTAFDFVVPTVALNGSVTQPSGSTWYYLIVASSAVPALVTALPPPVARTGNPDTTGLLLAALPANHVVIGIAKVVAAAEFTPGTTQLAAQGTFAAINSYPANGDPTGFTYASTSA